MRHYSLTDNLSQTLQKDKMSAVSGQRLTSSTTKTIQSMRNDSGFDLFYQTVRKKAEKVGDLNEPFLPRKRHQPNYSILQFVSGYEGKSDAVESYYPTTVKEHFKAIYFETIDAVHNALREGFEQPSFIIFLNLEHFVSVYADDVETTALPRELLILRTCLNL